MDKPALIEAIIKLMPPSPDLVANGARIRFAELSRTELEKIHGYLITTVESRSPSNARRKRWENAKSHASDMERAEPLLAKWHMHENRTRAWLDALAHTPSTPVETEAHARPTEDGGEGFDQPAHPTRFGDTWTRSINSAIEEIKSAPLIASSDVQGIVDRLDLERSDADLDERLDTIQLLEKELETRSPALQRTEMDRLGPLCDLLPWRWFARILQNLKQSLEKRIYDERVEIGFDEDTRERLTRLLSFLRRRDATPIRLASMEDDPDGLRIIVALANTFWRFPIDRVPYWIRTYLIPIFDMGAKRVDASLSDLTDRRQLSYLLQAVVRAYLLVSRIRETPAKEASPNLSHSRHASNVVQAFLAAERAGFLSNKTSFLEAEMIAQLERCVVDIPKDPSQYISENELSRSLRDFDICMNAAAILRFHAIIVSRFGDQSDISGLLKEALSSVDTGEKYYAYARSLVEEAKDIRLFAGRLARLLLLRADLQRKTHNPVAAVATLQAAAALIETEIAAFEAAAAGVESQLADNDTSALRFLRFVALVSIARISDGAEEYDQIIVEGLHNLINENPYGYGAWELLLGYLSSIRRDPGAARRLIEDWVMVAEQRGNDSLSTHLLYRRSRIFYDLATSDFRHVRQAIEEYLKLIAAQSRYLVVFEELCDLLEHADMSLVEALKPMVDEKLPSDTSNLVQALTRILFDLPLHRQDTNRLVGALRDLVSSHSAEAASEFGKLLLAAKRWEENALEYATRCGYQRGRKLLDWKALAVSDRILQGCLMADPNDLVWMSRRVDIAIQERDWNRARLQLDAALTDHPSDPILRLQESRIALLCGDPEKADSLLRGAIGASGAAETDSTEIHPAFVDQLALVALQRQQFNEAERLYRQNLDTHRLDPRAWLGLGRVSFERGEAHWPAALESWMQALSLQTDWQTSDNDRYARRTAGLIAGLFRHDTSLELTDQLSAHLERAPDLISILAGPLASAKAAEFIADKLMFLSASSRDIIAKRAVAQFLRANSVYLALSIDSAKLQAQVDEHVAWCLVNGVLSDYLAGAKSSYFRAIMRHSPFSIKRQKILGSTGKQWRGDWKALLDHVSTDGYSPQYYRVSEEFTSRISKCSHNEIVRFAVETMWALLQKRLLSSQGTATLLEGIQPEKIFIPAERLGKLDEDRRPIVSVIADEDIFNVAKGYLNGGGWRNNGVEILRPVLRLPTAAEIHQFSRGGIFFREASSEHVGIAYMHALPGWSRPAYDVEVPTLQH